MNLPRTPVPTLERAHRLSMEEGLQFVYIGNVPGHPAESTYCPGCRKLLIRRVGHAVIKNVLQDGRCPACSRPIPGVWS
jgi:pyruvate formate lyase activating enzyme